MTNDMTVKTDNPIASLEAWGKLGIEAGIVPVGTTKAQAMAIVQVGAEIGLQPFQALRSIFFVKGRMTMSAQIQLALARVKGVKVKKIEEAKDICTVTLARDGEEITTSFTLDDATKAGLTAYKEDGTRKKTQVDGKWVDRQDGGWEKWERQLLRWRAITDGLRMIAPEAILGLLSPEEAESLEPLTVQVDVKPAAKTFKLTPAAVAYNEDTKLVEDLEQAFGTPTEHKLLDACQNHLNENMPPQPMPKPALAPDTAAMVDEMQAKAAEMAKDAAKNAKPSGKFAYLEDFAKAKKALGDEEYYKALGQFGVVHANEVPEKDRPAVLEVLRTKFRALNNGGK